MAVRAYSVGFASTDTPGDIVTLVATVAAVSTYATLLSGGAAYQPSNTLYIGRVIFTANSATAEDKLVYGDDQGSPPTNEVVILYYSSGGALNPYQLEVMCKVPTSKYIRMYSIAANANHYISAFGIDV